MDDILVERNPYLDAEAVKQAFRRIGIPSNSAYFPRRLSFHIGFPSASRDPLQKWLECSLSPPTPEYHEPTPYSNLRDMSLLLPRILKGGSSSGVSNSDWEAEALSVSTGLACDHPTIGRWPWHIRVR